MAKTESITFKLEPEDKRRMEAACSAMGIPMSVAFTIFAKKVGQEYRIPFEVSANPFYSESNMNELKRRLTDIETGKSTLKEHELIEVDE